VAYQEPLDLAQRRDRTRTVENPALGPGER
jgi:hypothetical protein